MEIALSWLVLSFSVWVAAQLLSGFEIKEFQGAMVVAALFGVLNYTVGKVLFVLVGIGTLGLGFLFAFFARCFVSAILLKVVDAFSSSIKIRSFGTAILAAVVMSLFGTLGEWAIHRVF